MATLYKSNVTGAASTIIQNNLPENKVLLSDANGKISSSEITPDELNALDGVTSNIQEQIDSIPNARVEDSVLYL